MTRQQRKEKWETKVKALERIMAKPLSYEESIYFGERLAVAEAKLKAVQDSINNGLDHQTIYNTD